MSFNPDKCSCCWGCTIKIGNDTIKSDTDLIKIALGSNIEYPVNVHIEKGIFENECSNYSNSFYDYYQITKIEIID